MLLFFHTCTHTHTSNKNDYPGEFDEKSNRSTEKQTKIEEESKNAYEKFRGEFPILKVQTDLSKKSKNKIEKSFKKSPKLFSILFLKKKFLINFTYLLHRRTEFYHTTTAEVQVPVFFCQQRPELCTRLCSVCGFRSDCIRRDARYRHGCLCFPIQP